MLFLIYSFKGSTNSTWILKTIRAAEDFITFIIELLRVNVILNRQYAAFQLLTGLPISLQVSDVRKSKDKTHCSHNFDKSSYMQFNQMLGYRYYYPYLFYAFFFTAINVVMIICVWNKTGDTWIKYGDSS